MVNELRLIDGNKAQAVLVNMAEHLMEAGNPKMAGAVGYAAEVIGKQPTVDAVEVAVLKTWLYEIAMNNSDNYLGDACEVLIARLDGLREFARERRTDNGI